LHIPFAGTGAFNAKNAKAAGADEVWRAASHIGDSQREDFS